MLTDHLRSLENSNISPSHKRNKIITTKIGSFLGAEIEATPAQQIEDEHDDEDDSLISGSGFSGRLNEDFFGRVFEIFEQSRTQPSFHFLLWPAIPIASVFASSPNESGGVAWKGPCREDDFTSVCRVRDAFREDVQNFVGPADERFPHEAGRCVVEDPYSFEPVGENNRHDVHFLPVACL